jgi:carbamoylphosphate synthase large subunit
MTAGPTTLLCIAGFEKGQEFIREAKRQGARVIFVTVSALEHADWPRESIDEFFHMPDLYNLDDVIKGVSYLARDRQIDRIVALDDFDVQTAAALREHMRLPGMGDTVARRFRDKLAMRSEAAGAGILVPDFTGIFTYDRLRDFMARVPPPWVLKPRGEAAAIGIRKLGHADELWPALDQLGDRQSFYLLERYVPGEVFHVDSLIVDGEPFFAEAHRYGRPPMDVVQQGGIFITRTVERGSADDTMLKAASREVIQALGLERGVTHMEFIKGHEDGRFYFLETAARVGGANIAEGIEAATGVNLWAEWAKLELAADGGRYTPPSTRQDYAGVIISLARQEHPDTSAYQDPEIAVRLDKTYHAGFVIASPHRDRVETLLDQYSRRFYDDFHAAMPQMQERPAADRY